MDERPLPASILDQFSSSVLVVVSDQRMPGQYGNELLSYANQKYPDMVRILTTAHSELSDTIEAINNGHIHRYLQKPWDLHALRLDIKQAIEFAHLRRDHTALLREKLTIQKRQILAHRLGMLRTLTSVLSNTGQEISLALAAYINVAKHAPLEVITPDWMNIDYADWISLESQRFSQLWQAVTAALSTLNKQRKSTQHQIEALVHMWPELFQMSEGSNDKIAIIQPELLVEFLTASPETALSHSQIEWLAFLIGLNQENKLLEIFQPAQPADRHISMHIITAHAAQSGSESFVNALLKLMEQLT